MKKEFDAVEFQRKARKKLSQNYVADRKAFLGDLRKMYSHLRRKAAHVK